MPLYGKKTIKFPGNGEDFLSLAERKARSGEIARAIDFCYRAADGKLNEKNVLFIAKQLSEAHLYEKSNELIMGVFPDEDTRPDGAIEIMRRNFCGLYEYMQERKCIMQLNLRGKRPAAPDSDPDIDEILNEDGLMLNDPLFYGSDLSSLDGIAYMNKPVMALCVVLRSEIAFMNGDYDAVIGMFDSVMTSVVENQDLFLPAKYVFDNIPMFMLSCIFNDDMERQKYPLGRDNELGVSVRNRIPLVCVYAMLELMSGNAFNIDELAKLPAADLVDALCIARTLMHCDRYEAALPYAKTVRNIYPYMISSNHMYGACAYAAGEYDTAYECYDRICKMFPDDITAQYYKDRCKKAICAVASGENVEKLHFPDTYATSVEQACHYTEMLNSLLDLSPEELSLNLDRNSELCNIVRCLMPALQDESQLKIVERLVLCDGVKAEKLLRKLLLCPDISHLAKQRMLKYFVDYYPESKIAFCFGSSVIESYGVLMDDIDCGEAVYDVYANCFKIAKNRSGLIGAIAVNDVFSYYLGLQYDFDEIDENVLRAMAPCIQFRAGQKCRLGEDINAILESYPELSIEDVEEAAEMLDEAERMYIYDLYSDL